MGGKSDIQHIYLKNTWLIAFLVMLLGGMTMKSKRRQAALASDGGQSIFPGKGP